MTIAANWRDQLFIHLLRELAAVGERVTRRAVLDAVTDLVFGEAGAPLERRKIRAAALQEASVLQEAGWLNRSGDRWWLTDGGLQAASVSWLDPPDLRQIARIRSRQWRRAAVFDPVWTSADLALDTVLPGQDWALDIDLNIDRLYVRDVPARDLSHYGIGPLDLTFTEDAPRVLNANFTRAGTTELLSSTTPLEPGGRYNLVVEIGPPWGSGQSIVKGAAEFPDQALPPTDADGHYLEIVLASEAFTPHLVTGTLWLPLNNGPSSAVLDDTPTQNAPLLLPFTLKEDFSDDTARGRMFVYFENNLLQSAIVTAATAPSASRPDEEPTSSLRARESAIRVDFSLTRDFKSFASRLGLRKVNGTSSPVRLQIAMNDDGRNHRLVVKKGGQELARSVASAPYDPADAGKYLNLSRDELFACYSMSKPSERRLRHGGLERFTKDLTKMALLGNSLRSWALQPLNPADPSHTSWGDWFAEVNALLSEPQVIQVSHLGNANYVIPWALIYYYQLRAGKQLRTCKIVEEIWSTAVNTSNFPTDCPYGGEPDHQSEVICPFGFWGIKHLIEELPPGGMADPTQQRDDDRTMAVGPDTELAVAATTDSKLASLVHDHLGDLRNLPGIGFRDPFPSSTKEQVSDLVRSAALLYFFCHTRSSGADTSLWLSKNETISAADLSTWLEYSLSKRYGSVNTGPNSFVFLNACESTRLAPGKTLSFVRVFQNMGAEAVLGTEVSVRPAFARLFADYFWRSILEADNSRGLGEALRQARRHFLCDGSLMGLAYTLYGFTDVRFARS